MKELLPLILPAEILAHFEIVNVCNTSDKIDIYLDEKNIPPVEFARAGAYRRVLPARSRSRISRYEVEPFTFTFVVVNGNFPRERS